MTKLVCAKCFEDADIIEYIANINLPPGCEFCLNQDAPTACLDDVCDYIFECLCRFYGFAVDQLPYESKEGGYLAWHRDTHDLLTDVEPIELSDRGYEKNLLEEIISYVENKFDGIWCDYDWLRLDEDEEMKLDWESFCNQVKYKKRFFNKHPIILKQVIDIAKNSGTLIKAFSSTQKFYRARSFPSNQSAPSAEELGPPSSAEALQANRMNPPGIPIMYVAEDEKTAIDEIRETSGYIGEFQANRDFHILDFCDLPPIPSIFSGEDRYEVLGLRFIHEFVKEITKPIDRTQTIHLDYIPSQVLTEFIRNTPIGGFNVEGIRYPSSINPQGYNMALFAEQKNIVGLNKRPAPSSTKKHDHWIQCVKISKF